LKIKFWKLSGAGNDFIAFDNRNGIIPEEKKAALARDLCRRGMSIGSDGLILIEPSSQALFLMRIFMPDGSEAETCGNGSRCVARLAHKLRIAPGKMSFETLAGMYQAETQGDRARVSMTDPRDLKINIRLEAAGLCVPEIHFINTGVPHVVLFVKDLDHQDVVGIGRCVRQHPEFQPAGTNVNFVEPEDPHHTRIRTYERGVEDETLACGTGCIASAIIAAHFGHVKSPVHIKTKSGIINTVHFTPGEGLPTNIQLEGEARIVFEGKIEIDPDREK
jgi:diaminopimelate epimerase